MRRAIEKDKGLLDLAREHNRLDLELYSFAADEILPKLCEKAGLKPSDTVRSCEAEGEESEVDLYNMLFYRQLCKLIYCRKFHSGQAVRM